VGDACRSMLCPEGHWPHFDGCRDCIVIRTDCPNDVAAIESAKQFVNGHDIELWQQDRIIAKFERKPGGE